MTTNNTKTITKIIPLSPGSPPDIDSDFSQKSRDHAIQHVTEKYGRDKVCSIVTFGTLKSKGAFKSMCTIYDIPFSTANKITSLIPNPQEGVQFDLRDAYNPDADRYAEAEDFRNALADDDRMKDIFDGAVQIEGRNRTTGIHAAGIVISQQPLIDSIPLQVVKKEDKVVSQWVYKDLEKMGLIKMDFLGLETIDIIQRAVEYVLKNNKDIISMIDLIHGPMDDPKVYDLFQKGNTIGIFQFGSSMVIDLLKKIMPTKFEHLSATTAIARPGPMGMDSHNKYAARKNGFEEIDFIHPDFDNSPLEKILGETYGLLVYQEQVMQIASEIAGMTLQQGDDLRSAMGKKKIAVMESMKPLFFEGSIKNGYSEEAVSLLWDIIAEMAKYGFNKAHSVSYAMNSYQSAYLKVHYPVEFMASLITQATSNNAKKDKVLEYLKECNRMGIKVLTADVNSSDVFVSPDFANGGNNIIFGLSALRDVSETNAEIIVNEREQNGKYTSPQDFINRCHALGIRTAKVYESIALSGGFDGFGMSRKGIVEAIPAMINSAKKKNSSGDSLFDIFEDLNEIGNINISDEEYDFVEKLKLEANAVGLYLTGHPLEKVGISSRLNTIDSIFKRNKKDSYNILSSITSIEVKQSRGGGNKGIIVGLDDGTGYMNARLSKEAVRSIEKWEAREKLKSLYCKGSNAIPDYLKVQILNQHVPARPPLEVNATYIAKVSYNRGWGDDDYRATIEWIFPLRLSKDGELPLRMRFEINKDNHEKMKKAYAGLPKVISGKIEGDSPIFKAVHKGIDSIPVSSGDLPYFQALQDTKRLYMENKTTTDPRTWPPQEISDRVKDIVKKGTVYYEDQEEAIESLEYKDSGYSTEKSQRVEMGIEKYLGHNSYDFGVPKTFLREE